MNHQHPQLRFIIAPSGSFFSHCILIKILLSFGYSSTVGTRVRVANPVPERVRKECENNFEHRALRRIQKKPKIFIC